MTKLLGEAGFKLRETGRVIGAVVGTAVHAGSAHTLKSKVETGALAPVKDMQEVAMVALRQEMAEGETSMDPTSPNLSTAELQVQRMTLAYQLHVAPNIKPVYVERKFEAAISDHFIVSGSADVGQDGELNDTKTGVMRRSHWPQFGTYTLLARANGFAVNKFTEDFVKRGSIRQPQPEPTRHVYDVKVAEQMAQAVFQEIERKFVKFEQTGDPWVFMPNPSSMLCSDRYCPAWGTPFCRAHKPE